MGSSPIRCTPPLLKRLNKSARHSSSLVKSAKNLKSLLCPAKNLLRLRPTKNWMRTSNMTADKEMDIAMLTGRVCHKSKRFKTDCSNNPVTNENKTDIIWVAMFPFLSTCTCCCRCFRVSGLEAAPQWLTWQLSKDSLLRGTTKEHPRPRNRPRAFL